MIETPNRPLSLIFDLDGVLVHSMPLHVLSWEEYLAGLGIKVNDLERRMHGKRNSELVQDLIGGDLSEDAIFGHGAAKEALFREMLVRDNLEKYRIPGLLEFLERHPEWPKAIASNAEPKNIDFVLDEFGMRRFFQVAVNGLQVARGKPFPDVYLKAAELLGVDPKDCIVFEDSPTGLEAGLAAGMRVVGVKTTAERLEGSLLEISDFSDPLLEPWLATQTADHPVV